MTTLWCERAWLGGEAAGAGVVVELAGDRIAGVRAGETTPPDGAERLPGLTLPGLANAHSHAFQRALRGRTQDAIGGSFWTWREQMYALADRLDPDSHLALARATFGEMALAGITVVGEFHYVHHGPRGRPYAEPNAMGEAIIQAAAEVGVRLTLIDACYLQGGLDRFRDADADAWAARVERLAESERVRVGAAIHSLRAVDPDSAAIVAGWAAARGRVVHAHVSEQPRENEQCLAAHGDTPTGLLRDAGALDTTFTAVHATHLTDHDVARLGASRATVCLCPTTERDLADGVGPARRLADAGAALAVGSDSQAVVDLFEEARAIELDERLATGVRGHHRAHELLSAASAAGYASLGWPEGGRIAPGALADLTTVGLGSVRLAGTAPRDALAATVFAGAAPDVTDVHVGGRRIVRDGAHVGLDVARELHDAVGAVRA
jgi:formiminoglutamate deiminase